MYSHIPSLVLGFHGCDRETGMRIISDPQYSLEFSKNSYDWLGHGIYFWENSPQKALRWAKKAQVYKVSKGEIKEPFVLGAVIDLGNCLNLTDMMHCSVLEGCYHSLEMITKEQGRKLPQNTELRRSLDCQVINMVDYITDIKGNPKYDSVRSPYIEGKEVYPGAGFCQDTHIQICVRNSNCIKGYFIARDANPDFDIP